VVELDEVVDGIVVVVVATTGGSVSIENTCELMTMSPIQELAVVFHIFMYLSLEPLSKNPFGNNFKVLTDPVWPIRVFSRVKLAACHILIKLSLEPLTKLPDKSISKAFIDPEWPVRLVIIFLFRVSQITVSLLTLNPTAKRLAPNFLKHLTGYPK
jgi:hypothetical protein